MVLFFLSQLDNMNSIKLTCYFLFILLCSSKCKKDDITHSPNISVSKLTLDTIWSKPLSFSINPILNSNKDILMSNTFSSPNGEIFKLYDGNNGNLKWQWCDYVRPEQYFNDEGHLQINDALILCSHNATYALNIVTGQTLWKHYSDTMYGEPFIFKDDDGYIYHSFKGENGNATCYFFRTKYDKLNWELVCEYADSINYKNMSCSAIALSVNSKGEKLMIFSAYLVSPENKTMSRICCYNISLKKYEWIKDYTNTYAEFSVSKILEANNKVFTFVMQGSYGILTAINILDGSISWQQQLPEYGKQMFLYKDNIIVLSDEGGDIESAYTLCFNQNNGSKIWNIKLDRTYGSIDFNGGDANIFKNYLFSTQCGNLLVLNLDYGTVIFNKQVALPEGCLQAGVAINEQKRFFYVQDRYRVVCYKLPEEVKY